ncbi:hypothetical protein F4777DRAFT_424537 [Nemania sp. FL0916]|nr:hypothetical protein F4777DRAFT_424537 [Nemania sp. FL0916]
MTEQAYLRLHCRLSSLSRIGLLHFAIGWCIGWSYCVSWSRSTRRRRLTSLGASEHCNSISTRCHLSPTYEVLRTLTLITFSLAFVLALIVSLFSPLV